MGWEAKGRIPPCAGAASGTDQKEFFSKDLHPSDDLNQLLNEERETFSSIQPVVSAALEVATLSTAVFICTFSAAITLR